MSLVISKPLLAGLLATSVLTVIALLKPEPLPQQEEAMLSERRPAPAHDPSGQESSTPWVRHLLPLPKEAVSLQGFADAPARPVLPPVPVVPVAPPKPVAPTPSFSYLGRMVRDEHVYVFLARGDDVDVVEQGEKVDHDWRVERIAADSVELRYLPLNETRRLAMSTN